VIDLLLPSDHSPTGRTWRGQTGAPLRHSSRASPAWPPRPCQRLAAWRELVRQAPPAVLADALGVSAGTAMRHAFLAGADWSAYAAHRRALASNTETSQ
jgi:hypothetical protein